VATCAAPLPSATFAPLSPSQAISPRFVVYLAPRRSPTLLSGLDAEGWLNAASRKSRLAARCAARHPPRSVPADLRGKCFNCFSSKHRVASCKSSTRCFHCRASGHRSYFCPMRRAGCPAVAPSMAWRLVPAPTSMMASPVRASGGPPQTLPAAPSGSSTTRG
jgi:hypothetical protein